MPEHFPIAPRIPRPVLLVAALVALAGLLLGVRTTVTSLAWVGQVFPGFMVLDNRVVAAVSLPNWSGAAVPGLLQSEILAVDGRANVSRADIAEYVAALAPDTPVRWRLRKGAGIHEITIPTQRFTFRDWVPLHGMFLLNGVIFLATGLVVGTLRWQAPVARAVVAFSLGWSGFTLTAMDLYGPATFFRLHALIESLVAAALFQFTLLFPHPHRWARWRFAAYALGLVCAALYEWWLYDPPRYSLMLQTNMLVIGTVGVLLGIRLVTEYWRSRSQLARERIRVVMIGSVVGLALPGMLGVFLGFGEQVAINIGVLTPPVFMVCLGYAVLKHDVFEIDAMVKRGAYYLVVTGAVGAAYAIALTVFNVLLRTGAVAESPGFPIVFTLAVLLFFNPLRTRLQTVVDRLFFRTSYDGAGVLATVGMELGGALTRDDIGRIVRECVEQTIPNGATRLLVDGTGAGSFREVAGPGVLPSPLAARLGAGRVLTAFDPVEIYPDAASHAAVRTALGSLDAELAVPLRLRDTLVGALTVGRKRSGLFYTAGDAEFLRALAHEAAIALQNAASYEALAALNAELEGRVRERTAQLVQSEKLASLGRLVAGVAHEINNPVSFVAGSIAPLRECLSELGAAVPADRAGPLRDAEELVDIMARGAERTVAIVKDLRSFSRLGEEVRKPSDLHDGLDVTLRLLEPRWRDRIAIHREYGVLPPVECDPGQVNQVFMNLLANACDAIAGRGNIWVTTAADGDHVRVGVRDDGAGMTPEVLRRAFDPFFTTKDVGAGTGLGLAISHGIVTAHGGRIEVESTVGHGTTFQVVLPVRARALDRAAGGNE